MYYYFSMLNDSINSILSSVDKTQILLAGNADLVFRIYTALCHNCFHTNHNQI